LFDQRPEHQAPNAAEPVDCYFDCHIFYPFPIKWLKPNRKFSHARPSVNEEFRNEIAKTSPLLALAEEFNEPPNARIKSWRIDATQTVLQPSLMAKKAAKTVASSLRLEKSGHRPDATHQKPSSLLDTRVVYCGNNLEQLAKLPDLRGLQIYKYGSPMGFFREGESFAVSLKFARRDLPAIRKDFPPPRGPLFRQSHDFREIGGLRGRRGMGWPRGCRSVG
jgi:hypothetical protein